MSNLGHVPVLLNEVISLLKPGPNQNFVDGTFGAGGHARAILEKTRPSGKLLALDLNAQSLAEAYASQKEDQSRIIVVNSNFKNIDKAAADNSFEPISGILLDLGFSSMQMSGQGGFSFLSPDRLDMRFDTSQKLCAHDIVNHWEEKELVRILKEYGEEKFAGRIARAIRNQRPINTGLALANIVCQAMPKKYWPKNIHPATRAFQAIRIAVNDEINNLIEALPRALAVLSPGGRLAVVSFHSLEDRIVKNFFKAQGRGCVCPSQLPVCVCRHKPSLKIITKKPVTASPDEVKSNPRASSAKLRVAEKI